MYFVIINIALLIFFVSMLVLGIRGRIWAFIPFNIVGFLTASTAIGLDAFGMLNHMRLIILMVLLLIVFVFDFVIAFRDIRGAIELDETKIYYLTSPFAFEFYKIISDQRMMKKELDENNDLAISDRLQALQSWKLGNRAFMKKNYQEALEKYDLSCTWVNTAICYLNQSGVLIRLKQYDDGIALAQKSLEINPDFFEAYMNLGVANQFLNKPDKALSMFEKAVNLKPESFEAWFCLGFIQLRLKKYESAVESYNKSISYNNQFYESWYNKGLAQKQLGMDDLALKSFNKVVNLEPNHYQAHFHKGNILNEMDYNEEALESYKKALKVKSDYVEVWNSRGIVLCKMGKIKLAIKSYDKAIKINPKYSEAWINKALAEDSIEKYKKALESYQKFLDLATFENSKYAKIARRRISEIKDQLKSKSKPQKKANSDNDKKSMEIRFAEDYN
ncbi:tetratricopeptide repeat protein [candidate division KSB1 bacterium]|nr:tetratricopeptide repeat protein [candidate division KSB1 bacterium]